MRIVVRSQVSRLGYTKAFADLISYVGNREGMDSDQVSRIDDADNNYKTAFNFAGGPAYRDCQPGDLHNGIQNIVLGDDNLYRVLAALPKEATEAQDLVGNMMYQAKRLFSETFFHGCGCGKRVMEPVKVPPELLAELSTPLQTLEPEMPGFTPEQRRAMR